MLSNEAKHDGMHVKKMSHGQRLRSFKIHHPYRKWRIILITFTCRSFRTQSACRTVHDSVRSKRTRSRKDKHLREKILRSVFVCFFSVFSFSMLFYATVNPYIAFPHLNIKDIGGEKIAAQRVDNSREKSKYNEYLLKFTLNFTQLVWAATSPHALFRFSFVATTTRISVTKTLPASSLRKMKTFQRKNRLK